MCSTVIGIVRRRTSGGWVQWCVRGALSALVAASAATTAAEIEPASQDTATPAVDDTTAYRALGARHLYERYGERVFKGQLPPLLYAIAIIETDVDENGEVVSTVVSREPASAKDVIPWILGLIKSASPFPKPGKPGLTRYHDIWLVDRSYTFQLHTLTEGQR